MSQDTANCRLLTALDTKQKFEKKENTIYCGMNGHQFRLAVNAFVVHTLTRMRGHTLIDTQTRAFSCTQCVEDDHILDCTINSSIELYYCFSVKYLFNWENSLSIFMSFSLVSRSVGRSVGRVGRMDGSFWFGFIIFRFVKFCLYISISISMNIHCLRWKLSTAIVKDTQMEINCECEVETKKKPHQIIYETDSDPIADISADNANAVCFSWQA